MKKIDKIFEIEKDQKEDRTLDDRRRDGGTNSTLRTKEHGKHLTLNEHDDDDDDDEKIILKAGGENNEVGDKR